LTQPPYTDQQQAEFKEIYARRRRRQLLVSVPLIGLILVMAFLRERVARGGEDVLVWGFIGAVAFALLFSIRNWRCPACERYLGRSLYQKHCHHCGIALLG
jgi:hypothetical protein